MGDVLTALAIPVLLCATGIYAACSRWWRRTHPAPPPYAPSAGRSAELDLMAVTEGIIRESWAEPDALYYAASASPDRRVGSRP
ncbi:hypothetical protein AR457_15465 [Streptomyces agglomeratus]|uniref:Uncharacterized protein n=1 Tax=Streptomyces agglomeratus TaxID=285458 RepID=A0A1E5P806_9ACTN|nr:hypothetical protein [Streptomyces agglomeratus]OEJ25658.1 hypothetical protein AS594_15280 [Streptomyces agglomeratus]OEJ40303.1 hypothetical protein BGK70_21190 [Streptomyces agglomeratus]OEJ45319.1 hypothetical protein AR457_15465 [Streptomyces agglomeratus]OEJ52852.1 hypothetical protein BGK72_20830 [Streptomyces agglomeratus]OEJ60188.1 hypothetical protein BGM19_21530 [Streptomyces agglomeratus]